MAVLVKSRNGLAYSSVKTINGLAVGSIKTLNGLDVTSGGGGPTLIANTVKGGIISGVTTDPINTSGADFLVVALSAFSPSGPLTDNYANTWIPLSAASIGPVQCRLFYCFSPLVGANHDFTFGNFYPSIAVQAWSGVTSYDSETGNTSTGSATVSPGSITPAQSNELFITAVTLNRADSMSIDSSFSISDQEPLVGGDHFGVAMASKVVTSGAAQNPQWTISAFDGSTELESVMAAFKF